MSKSGRTPKEILTYLRQQNAGCLLTAKDVSNIVQKERIAELGGKRPIELLVSCTVISYIFMIYSLAAAFSFILRRRPDVWAAQPKLDHAMLRLNTNGEGRAAFYAHLVPADALLEEAIYKGRWGGWGATSGCCWVVKS
ncbi:hypothetical protein DL98DRAFT_620162 [Cadophora sp. DSE1049]|nr:hypothetical protein DL98DRAFT_620162 [Cadophora sp. DSE1049]